MANKLVVKNVMKLCVSITLFAVYVYLFGTKSIRKYMDNEIIITDTEQEDEDLHWTGNEPPPGIVYYKLKVYIINKVVTKLNCSHHNISM